jgi:hypothetical protein
LSAWALLVDYGIVLLENITRHWAGGKRMHEAVGAASVEVTSALLGSISVLFAGSAAFGDFDVAVRVQGPDPVVLAEFGERVRDQLGSVEGLSDLTTTLNIDQDGGFFNQSAEGWSAWNLAGRGGGHDPDCHLRHSPVAVFRSWSLSRHSLDQ